MNCQHESEHNSQKTLPNTEQQPMETLDYLRLASFIHYLGNAAEQAGSPVNTLAAEG